MVTKKQKTKIKKQGAAHSLHMNSKDLGAFYQVNDFMLRLWIPPYALRGYGHCWNL